MDYNDYPESIDDNVVNTLNSQYAARDNVSVVNEFKNDIKIAQLDVVFSTLLNDFGTIIELLKLLKKYDKMHANLLDSYIEYTLNHKGIVEKYSPQKELREFILRNRRFGILCKKYFDTELDVITVLTSVLTSYSEDNEMIFKLMQTRVDIFKNLFNLYT